MTAEEQEALFEQLARSRKETLALLETVDLGAWVNEQTGRRGQDIIAHIAAWERNASLSLEAYQAGGAFQLRGPFDIHAINERIFEAHRDAARDDVLEAFETSRERMVAVSRAIPPALWEGPVTYPWGAQGTVEHLLSDMRGHEEHHHKQLSP